MKGSPAGFWIFESDITRNIGRSWKVPKVDFDSDITRDICIMYVGKSWRVIQLYFDSDITRDT